MTGTQHRRRSSQPETRRRNSRGRESGRREAGSAEKQMKKLLTTPCRCDNLYELSLEADREERGTAEKKNKKVLDKAKEI